jgi:hypothetical protein
LPPGKLFDYNHHMDIFFSDPTEVPLPPDEVRIRNLQAEPWPDGQRVKVYLEVDPFQKRPNVDVLIFDQEGREVTQTSVVESMTRKMEFTIHLRRSNPAGSYKLQAILFYTEPLPQPDEGEQIQLEMPASTEVDRAEVDFTVTM